MNYQNSTQDHYKDFVKTVWQFYKSNQRDLPWRRAEKNGTYDPYKIMVSEVMLQQTQVARVIPKYKEFLENFPTITDLATAQLADVLRAWVGLGYNRRGKFLHSSAQQIVKAPQFRWTFHELCNLPGIGKNTAAAIRVYAFNDPIPFVETNIRTVYIHHFYLDESDIHDAAIIKLVDATLPKDKALTREWFWALMDYGVYLKQTVGNVSRRSRHYTKQTKFEGSRRQLRSTILRSLLKEEQSIAQIKQSFDDERTESVLKDLQKEQLITYKNKHYVVV